MFERFLFCFKHKLSAILMGCMSLTLGIIGTIYFTVKISNNFEKTDEHFLLASIFLIFVSGILLAGIIWEKPLLILSYEFVNFATLVSLLVFIIIYVEHSVLNWIILISSTCFMSYWIFCIHLYYRQLRLKVKSMVSYIDSDVYSVCNKLYVNKYTSFK